MLFTPKKYKKDWTLALAVCFSAASLGFGIAAVAAGFAHFDEPSVKILSVIGFLIGAVISGALGSSTWKAASERRG